MNKVAWDSILALTVAVGMITLIGLGCDGEVKAMLGVAVGYIFGKKIAPPST